MKKVSLAFLCVLTASPVLAQSTPVERGLAVYMSHGCYQCHGTTGASGGAAGVPLQPVPTLDAVKKQVRTPMARMPAYSAHVITDAQIADIVAYLKSVPPSPKAADIPELNR